VTAGGSGGVIFDADGTLLDINYLHVAAWWDASLPAAPQIIARYATPLAPSRRVTAG
jgi:hypothetical protein